MSWFRLRISKSNWFTSSRLIWSCIPLSVASEFEVLLREVYTKTSKGALTVQKFLAGKTNKDGQDPRFPAYVFNYTNYSPGRAAPLKRDVRISQSEKQTRQIATAFIEKNIKKGWSLVNDADGGEAEKPVEAAAKKPAKKKSAKETAETKPAKKKSAKETEAKPAKKKAAKKSAKKKAAKK